MGKNPVENNRRFHQKRPSPKKLEGGLWGLSGKIPLPSTGAHVISFLAAGSSLYYLSVPSPWHMKMAALFIFINQVFRQLASALDDGYSQKKRLGVVLERCFLKRLIHYSSENMMLFFLGWGLFTGYGYLWALLGGFFACILWSHFPDLMAAQVMIQRTCKEEELPEEEEKSWLRIVGHLQGGALFRGPGGFFWHLLSLPPSLLLLTLLLDLVLGDFMFFSYAFNLRLLLLLLLPPVYLVYTVKKTWKWMGDFETI